MTFMKKLASCWIIPAAFVVDRLTKVWAHNTLRFSMPVDVWPGVFRFAYVENTGAAFGLFHNQRIPLLVMTGIAILLLFAYFFKKYDALPKAGRFALCLLLAGALGNYFDRLFLSYVIDFLEITLIRFPVFNIADCCVVLSFVILSYIVLFTKEAEEGAG